MAKPKKATEIKTDKDTSEDKPKARTIIRAKEAFAWDKLLKTAQEKAWRRLRVELQVRDKFLAGKPAALDAANAMLKARGLEDQIHAVSEIVDPSERAKAAERIASDEGLCEFSRRAGKPGIWIPSNNLKAMIKENWSVLGLRVKVRGSRGALAEGLFVCGADATDPAERDWIYLGEEPDGVHQAVAHTTGPSGPVSSIKRHEYVNAPKIVFEVWIANADSVAEKISDDELAQMFVHAQEHGTGSCRSQGFGKFDVKEIRELDGMTNEEVEQKIQAA